MPSSGAEDELENNDHVWAQSVGGIKHESNDSMVRGRKHQSTHKESGGTSGILKKDAADKSGESESYSRKSQSNMSKLVGAQGSRKHSQQKKTFGGVSQMDLARVKN